MPFESYFSEETLRWIVIPLLIFVARLTDVTIGTLRLIFTARGFRQIAPVLGFFEVLIWIVAMSQIMRYADNWPSYLAWAGGFAAGNYTGLKIEERLALGNLLLRVITALPADDLMEALLRAASESPYWEHAGVRAMLAFCLPSSKEKTFRMRWRLFMHTIPMLFIR